jgi:hypothetical protein
MIDGIADFIMKTKSNRKQHHGNKWYCGIRIADCEMKNQKEVEKLRIAEPLNF